jgi:hypothetical protein
MTNLILPSWAKYVAYATLLTALFGSVWGHGFVKGIERTNDKQLKADFKIIKVQGKVTQKMVADYVKKHTKQKKVNEEIKNEGQGYAIQFPDDGYTFNNEYVRLYNNSVTGTISSLSSGNPGDSSGVTPSDSLEVGIHNNTVARQWQERALMCEGWAEAQENANN